MTKETTETQKPKICPLMSKPVSGIKHGRVEVYRVVETHEVHCRKEKCELWDTGGKMCSHRAVSDALWEVVDELRSLYHIAQRLGQRL